MILTLYKTEIRPEMNAAVESISKYLTESRKAYEWQNVKYTKPELDIMLKLPLGGHFNSLKQFDYAVLRDEQEQRTYYYFVIDMDWKAKMTLRLQLSMDTLTTFWGPIREGLTQNTHVTRRYFDRWHRIGDKLYPVIDEHPEDIAQPSMMRIGKPTVVGDEEHWTIVYMTEYDGGDVGKNPVSCLALPDDGKPVEGTVASNSVNYASFADQTVCVLDYAHAPNATIKWTGKEYKLDAASAKVSFEFQHSTKRVAIRWWQSDGWQITSTDGYVTIAGTPVLYEQPANFPIDMDYAYWQFNKPVVFNGGQLISFAQWFDYHKADSRLIKIIELPYAPFVVKYNSAGEFLIPTGWEMTGEGALRLVNPMAKFSTHVADVEDLAPSPIDYSAIAATTKADPLKYETKLWNSNYKSTKFVYDGNAHVVKLENFSKGFSLPEAYETQYDVAIRFQSSTGMDNSTMFKFESMENMDSDFGEYLVCNRTTEIPYYTNEYLNYLRYGKAVDDRNFGWKTASTITSGVGSTVQTSASLAFAVAGASIKGLTGGIGGAIGLGVGLASTLIATSASISQSRDQMNAKIDNYTHQASAVSAANDLSLFRQYGKNKLLRVEYEPHQDIQKAIGRYFELYGYGCDEYGVPKWNTRIWSDYFVMEPEFNSDVIFKDYEADIATRMKAGFRVLHYYQDARPAGPIDFENQYENWERSLIA